LAAVDAGDCGAAPDPVSAPDAAYVRSREHALARSAEGREEREQYCGNWSFGFPALDRQADPDYWQDPDPETERPTPDNRCGANSETARPTPDDRHDPEATFQLPITGIPYIPRAAEGGADTDNADRRGRGNEPVRAHMAAIELLLSLILLLTCATPSAGSTRRAAQPSQRASSVWSSAALIGGNVVAIVASGRYKNLGSKATCQYGSVESRDAIDQSKRSAKIPLPPGGFIGQSDSSRRCSDCDGDHSGTNEFDAIFATEPVDTRFTTRMALRLEWTPPRSAPTTTSGSIWIIIKRRGRPGSTGPPPSLVYARRQPAGSCHESGRNRRGVFDHLADLDRCTNRPPPVVCT
jgi:hypothetical protein